MTATPRSRAASPAAASGTAAAARRHAAQVVLRQFRQVFNSVKTHFRQIEKSAGMGGAQLWALSVIDAHPGIGVGALARAMDIHQTTTSNLVKQLVQAELVAAERSGSDRRAVQLRALPAGTRALRKAPAPLAGVLPEALARLDGRTLERLQDDLAALLAVMEVDQRAAGIPLAQM